MERLKCLSGLWFNAWKDWIFKSLFTIYKVHLLTSDIWNLGHISGPCVIPTIVLLATLDISLASLTHSHPFFPLNGRKDERVRKERTHTSYTAKFIMKLPHSLLKNHIEYSLWRAETVWGWKLCRFSNISEIAYRDTSLVHSLLRTHELLSVKG